ncbi:MAG: type IX secretion system membrane protein PorP/SprF [Bacteroidetes bacterium]|nr:MAG: type IX secretion system membrane protein PorP/SprF [Bacteroidota bacterium]
MFNKHAFIYVLICVISLTTSYAQDPQFSQFYGVPLYTNPALTGVSGNIRANIAYRDQYIGLDKNFKSTFAGIDAPTSKLGGGIGLTFLNDVAGDGSLTTNQISGVYAFHASINRKVRMSLAIQAGVVQKTYDWSKFKFGDQIDDRFGFVNPTKEPVASELRFFPNFGSGFLIYSDRFFGGAAVHNMIEPNQSFYFENSPQEQFKLPRRYTAHAGMNIYLTNQRNEQERVILSPNILFMNQRNYNQLNLGLYIKKQALTTGLWFRQTSKNTDAAIVLIGLKFPKFRVGYSYDITVSGARTATQGSQELSVSFEIKPPKRPKPRNRALVCPAF